MVDLASPRLWLRPRAGWARVADRAGLGILLGVGLVVGVGFAVSGFRPVDTDLYWRTGQAAHYYGATWAADPNSFYVYPPPLAQLTGLLAPIGWGPFVTLWAVVIFAGFWAMTRGLSLLACLVCGGAALAFGHTVFLAEPLVVTMIGNVQPWLMAAIILGFRWPAAWALVVLTKIAPGIGLLWFAFRGEWRNLAIALGVTSAVVVVSLAAAPGAWAEFVRFAIDNANAPSPNPIVPIPLPVRVAMSVVLIAWAARTDRAWVLPFAAGWSSIALYQWSWVTMALASLAMLGWSAWSRWTGDDARSPSTPAPRHPAAASATPT